MTHRTGSRAVCAAAWAGLLLGVLSGAGDGAGPTPACGAAWAAERVAGRRLLSALMSSSGTTFELWERTFEDGLLERSRGREDAGPDGKGAPSGAYYVLRRSADGATRTVVAATYVRDWVAGRAPGADVSFAAAMAADPRAETLHVVVSRADQVRCDLEHLAIDATAAGATYEGTDPFPAEDPCAAWPAGPVFHQNPRGETTRADLPAELGPATRITLLCDEVGLLVHVRTLNAPKAPVYLRRRHGTEGWRAATVADR